MSSSFLPNVLLATLRTPVLAIGFPLAFGVLSGFPTAQVVRGPWYNSLRFPPGRPPKEVFPIVWPLLYICNTSLALGIALYYTQLAMNFAWTPLFFGLKRVGLALIDSVLMTGTTLYAARLLHGPTGSRTTYLLFPYCGWLCFAVYLNAGIWWLNRERTLKKEE
ncbi:TspO/MBR-related protein [Lentinula raphanica]|nr:TspO/MBR-related protein [Lentinula raphanica]